jgi:hypothetical protein
MTREKAEWVITEEEAAEILKWLDLILNQLRAARLEMKDANEEMKRRSQRPRGEKTVDEIIFPIRPEEVR